MKITIFGASGKTGREIIKQALALGHQIKAFVRDPQKLEIKDPKLTVVVGDVLDSQTVEEGIEGAEAVIVALGPKPENILAQGTENIIQAMKKHGVRRLIIESSYPMSGSPEGMEFLRSSGMTEEQIEAVRPALEDKINQEKAVRESGLDWLIVRPLILTDGPRTGQYRVGEKLDVKPGDTISRADVADFMLKSLRDDTWLGKTVVLSY